MSALIQNLLIEQGANFAMTVSLTDDSGDPLDVTGYSACSQVRVSYDSANAVGFQTEMSNGQLLLLMDANTTGGMSYGRYVWDAKLDDGMGTVVRIAQGMVTVAAAVSK